MSGMRHRGGDDSKMDFGDNPPSNEKAGFSRSARRALKHVDMYPKMHREFKVQTEFGATISLLAGVIMLVLFISELYAYMSVHTHEHMVVDSMLSDQLQINLDMSFLGVNCKDANINTMDVSGDMHVNMHHTLVKSRLDAKGNKIGRPISMASDDTPSEVPSDYCGSCYGAPHPLGKECCNTCDELKEAFMKRQWSLEDADGKEQCVRESISEEKQAQEGEGCRFTGNMMVNRVAGNFHLALGRTFYREGKLIHQFRPGEERTFNASHVIHSLSFGTPYPGVSHPLDGVVNIAEGAGGFFQYFIKVVPTIYSDISSDVHSYQYSYTQHARYLNSMGRMESLPGAFFVFDFSPFMVKVENDRVPLTHFLVKICAIIGGVVSIAGFLDAFIYNSLHMQRQQSSTASKYG